MDGMTLPLSVLVGDGASSPMSDCSETAGISRVDLLHLILSDVVNSENHYTCIYL